MRNREKIRRNRKIVKALKKVMIAVWVVACPYIAIHIVAMLRKYSYEVDIAVVIFILELAAELIV